MVEICQRFLPVRPWEQDITRRLPGLNPTPPGEWLLQDDAYAAQMAYRVELMATRQAAVHQITEGSHAIAHELLDLVLTELDNSEGFDVTPAHVTCPDGRTVEVDRKNPLLTCGALAQEDLVILEKNGAEHVLTGAILCFPASWTLAEKFMQPMVRIHVPVKVYTDDIAKRVQRLLDGIQVSRPMWRGNYMLYDDPELFQPRREQDPRHEVEGDQKWLRVERQGLRKLERSGAVIFSIHTYVLSAGRLAELNIDLPAPSGH